MHISEREKLSYITRQTPPPTASEKGYDKWYADNQKVKRWLLMSMSPDIMKRYLRIPTAREIWSTLSKVFYDGNDEMQVLSLHQKAFSPKKDWWDPTRHKNSKRLSTAAMAQPTKYDVTPTTSALVTTVNTTGYSDSTNYWLWC
ncbi:uncharacterized protein [Henckelia pumila]|uniref:uncharacterized protein n=1 Tax=Henckelia pumila TaxID=405737 RepID=UPI003C6DBA00